MLAILSKLAAALSDFDFTLGSRSGAGAVTTGVTAAEYGDGVIHQTVLTLSSVAITMTDAGAAGSHGSKKVYDFPAGLIHILGATTNLTTLAGSGGIGDTGALVGSLGSVAVATDNATLTSTEANVVPSTDGTLVGGAGTLKGKSTTAPAPRSICCSTWRCPMPTARPMTPSPSAARSRSHGFRTGTTDCSRGMSFTSERQT